MNEIEDSTTRISHLVDAAKQYSQLDRAPYQVVDVHELLDSTLLMLAGKIGAGIKVVKEYDRTLPRIPAYPAELNQVWTNLIDNAVLAATARRRRHADGADRARRRPAAGGVPRHRPRGPAGDPRAGSSTRSSPPSRWARAPGSAWTSPGGSSSTSTTATCRSSPCPGDTRFQVLPAADRAADQDPETSEEPA